MTRNLENTLQSWGEKAIAQIWSNDQKTKKIGNIVSLPWQEGLKELFLLS